MIKELMEEIGNYTNDPYGFVMFAFQWGEGELKGYRGPQEWQRKILVSIGDELKKNRKNNRWDVVRRAVSSGRGIGKSCLVSWLILWAMTTCEDTRGIVTANTEVQLRTKTWAELAKWHRLSIVKELFTITATAIYSANPAHEKTWRVDCIPWSENKPEAFAGLHNEGKRMLMIFDESAAIADVIWDISEGALTDENTEILWCVFGNPTRNNGRFFECFNGRRNRWHGEHIDSRTCDITNKAQIQQWVEDFGEDSDFVRVHVRGVFPAASTVQFISRDIVEMSRGKHLREEQYNFAPVIIGVDPAWQGGDTIEIFMRQGLMSKHLMTIQKNDDDIVIAGYVARLEDEYKADAVFIDLGYGTGIYSAGKQMGRTWTLVAFGGKSSDEGFLNKRAQMWNDMKKWMQDGGAIPNDPVLCSQLMNVEYRVSPSGANCGKIFLESKENMKDRGLDSPNKADALSLTFAFPVRSKKEKMYRESLDKAQPYDPLSMRIGSANLVYDPFKIFTLN